MKRIWGGAAGYRSVIGTSTASNPAASNAAAISTCPLMPCSRSTATRDELNGWMAPSLRETVRDIG